MHLHCPSGCSATPQTALSLLHFLAVLGVEPLQQMGPWQEPYPAPSWESLSPCSNTNSQSRLCSLASALDPIPFPPRRPEGPVNISVSCHSSFLSQKRPVVPSAESTKPVPFTSSLLPFPPPFPPLICSMSLRQVPRVTSLIFPPQPCGSSLFSVHLSPHLLRETFKDFPYLKIVALRMWESVCLTWMKP